MHSDFEDIYMLRKGSFEARRRLHKRYRRLVIKHVNMSLEQYGLKGSTVVDGHQIGLISFERCLINYDGSRNSGLGNFLLVALTDQIKTHLRPYISKRSHDNKSLIHFENTIVTNGSLSYYDVVKSNWRESCPTTYWTVRETDLALSDLVKQYFKAEEYDMICMRAQGYSYKEIAEKHRVSTKHVDNILQKLRKMARTSGHMDEIGE